MAAHAEAADLDEVPVLSKPNPRKELLEQVRARLDEQVLSLGGSSGSSSPCLEAAEGRAPTPLGDEEPPGRCPGGLLQAFGPGPRATTLGPMAKVVLTTHLYRYFPQLEGEDLEVPGATVAEVVQALEERAPGFAFYVCDERGRKRIHVNIFVDKKQVIDPGALSDPVSEASTVHIMQALSGG